MFCSLIWVVVTWVWSVYENLPSCIVRICVLYVYYTSIKGFFNSISYIKRYIVYKTPRIRKSKETESRLEVASVWEVCRVTA